MAKDHSLLLRNRLLLLPLLLDRFLIGHLLLVETQSVHRLAFRICVCL